MLLMIRVALEQQAEQFFDKLTRGNDFVVIFCKK